MGIRLRLPDIKGNDKEQLRQLRSYLYQLVPQLQWALDQALRDEEIIPSEAPNGPTENAPVPAAIFCRNASAANARTAAAWTELGLTDAVSAPSRILGRGGAGCRYLLRDGRVFVAFCCSAPAALPVRVSATPLPESCRPTAPVCAVCYAEFTNGTKGFATAGVTPEGHVEIFSAEGGEGIGVIDGYVEFWVS